jgi:hypothetical protein
MSKKEIFYPVLRQKVLWGWVSCIASLFSFVWTVGVNVYSNSTGNEIILVSLAVSLPVLVAALYFQLRYIFAGYRAELSEGTLMVVSPLWWAGRFELSSIRSIGCKGPEHLKIWFKYGLVFRGMPNYRSKSGLSLYEALQEACDQRSAIVSPNVYAEPISNEDFSDVILSYRIKKYSFFFLLLVIVGYLFNRFAGWEVFALIPLAMTWWHMMMGGHFSFISDDSLLVSDGVSAFRYDASCIVGACNSSMPAIQKTYVYLTNGEKVSLKGKHEFEMNNLLNRV